MPCYPPGDLRRLIPDHYPPDIRKGWLYWIEDYEAAGCPFGRTLEAILRWARAREPTVN